MRAGQDDVQGSSHSVGVCGREKGRAFSNHAPCYLLFITPSGPARALRELSFDGKRMYANIRSKRYYKHRCKDSDLME